MTQSILIADDSIAIRRAVQDALHSDDYRLEFTRDGQEAVDLLEGSSHDLVIADLYMPGKSGYQVAIASKRQHPNVPVLLLIGTFEAFDPDAFERCGADACLKKPFEASEIRDQVQELLRLSPEMPPTHDEPSSPEPEEEEPEVQPPVSEVAAPVGEIDAPGPEIEAPGPEIEAPGPEIPPADLKDRVASDEEAIEGGESALALQETVEEGEAVAGIEPRTLSAEEIDRIARRVVEIAGDGVLREVAWEVVPDLAEVIIRERLERLESELEESS